MDFNDKLLRFLKPLPFSASLHVRTKVMTAESMDVVYQATRHWGHIAETSKYYRSNHQPNCKIIRYRSRNPAPLAATDTESKETDDLDTIRSFRMTSASVWRCKWPRRISETH